MNAENHDAGTICAEALRLTAGDERRAYLDRACTGNPELREEVDSLFQAHKPADDSLGNSGSSPDTHSYGSMLGWVSVMFLLYVLSIGPVVKIALEGWIPKEAVETIYAPIVWLCETPVGQKFVRPSLIWYGEKIWQWKMEIPPK